MLIVSGLRDAVKSLAWLTLSWLTRPDLHPKVKKGRPRFGAPFLPSKSLREFRQQSISFAAVEAPAF